MSTVSVFVGLDYHDRSVQVCVLDWEGKVLSNRSVANDVEEITEVVGDKSGRVGGRVFAAVEACNGSADLADKLIQLGWSVDLAHPGYVARMKQSPDKTDYSDARLVADLERVGYLPKVWLAPHAVRELRRVVRYRQQLVDERRDDKLRIGALLREQRTHPPASCRPWTVAWLRWVQEDAELSEHARWIMKRHLRRIRELSEDIMEVERRLRGMTAEDPIVEGLLKLKGVGLITAVTLRAEIGRFDRFRTGKQLARFCGLSPRNASSGQKQADAGLIKAGNPQLRATLIQAAHRLKRHDPRWRALAQQLRERGKAASLVAAAIANRWVRSIFHLMQPVAA